MPVQTILGAFEDLRYSKQAVVLSAPRYFHTLVAWAGYFRLRGITAWNGLFANTRVQVSARVLRVGFGLLS